MSQQAFVKFNWTGHSGIDIGHILYYLDFSATDNPSSNVGTLVSAVFASLWTPKKGVVIVEHEDLFPDFPLFLEKNIKKNR